MEFYRNVRREFYKLHVSSGDPWLFSDEERKKLESIPGVLGLAAEMDFLEISDVFSRSSIKIKIM